MSISYISSGGPVYSTGNPSPTTPSHSNGDLLVLVVGTKPDTTPATAPSGWTLVGAASGGAGTTGIDTGPMRVGVFIRIADGSGSDTTGAITVTGNNVSAAEVHVFRNATGLWDIAGVGGADTSTGATFSVAMASNPGITAGHMLFAVGIIPTDITTPSQFSSEQVSATGLTTVSLTEIDELDSSSGSDMGGWQAYGSVVTGTATGNPTVTSTAGGTTTNVAGPIFLLRMGEASSKTGTDTASVAISDSSSVTATDVAPVEYRASSNLGNTALVSSRVPTYPTTTGGIIANDLCVIRLARWDSSINPAITQPGGWTQLTQVVVGSQKLDTYVKRMSGGESGNIGTFSWTGSMWTAVGVQLYRNVDIDVDLTTLRQHQTTTTGGVTAFASTTLSAVPDGAVLDWAGANGNSGTHTPPTNWTEDADMDALSLNHRVIGSPGSVTASGATNSVSGDDMISSMLELPAEPVAATPITGTDTASVTITESIDIVNSFSSSGDTAALTVTEGTTKLRKNVTYVDQYVLQAGTTSIGLTPPAGTAAGDADIIWVANKNSTATPSAPSGGWTQLFSDVVGTGSNGAGTGPIRITAWWRELTGASTSTTVTITGANVSMGGGMVYRKDSGLTWNITGATGSDTSSGTGFSAAVASNLLMDIGDFLMSVGFFTLNTSLPGRGITIPGITNTVTGINSGGTATGNQLFSWTDHAFVTALGTQSAVSSTDGTAGAATTGGAMNIRVSADFVSSTTPITGTDTASVTISDSSSIAITTAIAGTDTASVTVTEGTTGLASSSDRTDTASVTISDASTNAVSSDRTDTASVSIADASAIQAGITGTDTSSISISDVATIVVSVSGTDTAALTVTEGTTALDSFSSRTDTASVSIADASTNSSTLAGTDTASVSIADASTNSSTLAGTDTASITISDSSAVVVSVTGTDTASVAIADVSDVQVGGVVGITGTDTASVTISDASAITAGITGTDTASVTISESVSISGTTAGTDTASVAIGESVAIASTSSVTDTASVSIADASTNAVSSSVTDTSSVSISDVATLVISVSGTDTASVTITEARTLSSTLDRTDTASVAIAESVAIAASSSVMDTSSVSIADAAAMMLQIAGTDTSSITITDTSLRTVAISVSDTSSISIAMEAVVDAPSMVVKGYKDGVWVQGNLNVWKDNQWKSAFVRRRSGGSWV